MQLAGGNAIVGPVGVSIDIEGAHPTDTFAAIVVVHNRFFSFGYKLLVEEV
jgi:hypothetical protein